MLYGQRYVQSPNFDKLIRYFGQEWRTQMQILHHRFPNQNYYWNLPYNYLHPVLPPPHLKSSTNTNKYFSFRAGLYDQRRWFSMNRKLHTFPKIRVLGGYSKVLNTGPYYSLSGTLVGFYLSRLPKGAVCIGS